MDRARKIIHNNKEVWVVDYSSQRGDELIETFELARTLVLAEAKPVVVLSIFDGKTYINSHFMNHVRLRLPELEQMIERNAIVGLTTVQGWILKGVNQWYRAQLRPFSSINEALDYLTQDEQ
ncbi:MAG: hypothetical protein ACOYW3_12795 [Bacteroidota bacterium]